MEESVRTVQIDDKSINGIKVGLMYPPGRRRRPYLLGYRPSGIRGAGRRYLQRFRSLLGPLLFHPV